MPQPTVVQVSKSYRALKRSDILTGWDGRPYIECPSCGKKLIVVQHPNTLDGLPFVQCDADCPDREPIVFVEG